LVGKPQQPLPATVKDADGNNTKGNLEAANMVNSYYVEKVRKIWAGRGVENSTRESAATSRSGDTRRKISSTFSFNFANAGRIAKIIVGLKPTSALGTDGIPVAILKMGSDVLARPISHLVNMSLSVGVFPSAFKTALIHPVYKGGGKAKNSPASYRPVAILCAMSKVLKTVAKEDLEAFMKANNILPASQNGFRKGGLCTKALATAHAAWVSAKSKSKVIGFDLSAAFDTVGREDLLPKMLAMGIGGKELKWFRCYLTDAKQCVVWDGQVSDIVDMEYGVRQGSLLGPVLYLLHVFDLPLSLEIRESDGHSTYANDTAVWVIAKDIEEVQRELQRLADAMAKFTRDNGLALNGAKTQVMIGGAKAKARDIAAISINVDGAEVKPSNSFKLLGVTFDQRFTVRPYLNTLAREARFWAGRVARLAQHLTRGQLLRQLGSGLPMGKLAHCLPVVARLRLPGLTGPIPEALASVHVAINDVDRSVVGHRMEDHILIKDLLEAAKFILLNQLVVRATAMAAWNAHVSNDGVDGSRNPVGDLMFGNTNAPTVRPTRVTAAGEVRVFTSGVDTLLTRAFETLNTCAELRDSKSKAEANRAATDLARKSPP
jgi:hypothetical protein